MKIGDEAASGSAGAKQAVSGMVKLSGNPVA